MHFSSNASVAIQPRAELTIEGLYGYHLVDDRITVNVAEIHNHRNAGNLSGTLSLEVWALSQPWRGGPLNGYLLAHAIIGRVSGQHYLNDLRIEMPFSGPDEGTWTLALALREWNGHGYDTLDVMNFAAPFVVAGSDRTSSGSSDNTPAFTAATGAATPVVAAPVAVVTEAIVDVATTTAAESIRTVAAEKGVSINDASVSALAQVKGLSVKVAEAIVAARPFTALEQLQAVKGIGAKTFEKLRDLLRL